MRRRPRLPLTLALALAALVGPAVALRAAPGGEGAATITAPELRDHVGYLASDELEGRGTGTTGERAAGEYVARAFARAGLEPAGEDGGYFQAFAVPDGGEVAQGARLRIERGAFSRDFALGEDAQAFGFCASGKVDAPLVFAGYGITDPERGWDDYAGLDVKGKAVLVLRHEPRRGGRSSRHAFFATKAQNAKAHGAAALLVVTGPKVEDTDDLVPFQGGGEDGGVLPAFHVRQSLVEGLFRLAGQDLAATQQAIDEAQRPRSLDLQARVTCDVTVTRRTLTARNVIGRLPGRDPALAKEVVVIGAHYDHVGLGGPGVMDRANVGKIHNGADDNASGTAGMLELAQAFASARPRRTILFMAFSGEERGLLGSEHWVGHPTVPLGDVVAMINLDMIGRLSGKAFEVGGVGTSPGLEALVKGALAAEGLEASLDPSGQGPSDHASFDGKRIPVLFFFTGLHDDYHRPTDDADKLDADGAARVTRAAFACALGLADADVRPPYTEVKAAGGPDRPRLGIMVDRERTGDGVGVGTVVDGGPAAVAGLRPGDVIVRLGGREVHAFQDLVAALGAQQWDTEVEVVVLRGDERLTLKAKLTRP